MIGLYFIFKFTRCKGTNKKRNHQIMIPYFYIEQIILINLYYLLIKVICPQHLHLYSKYVAIGLLLYKAIQSFLYVLEVLIQVKRSEIDIIAVLAFHLPIWYNIFLCLSIK